jgi:hypothetical protein
VRLRLDLLKQTRTVNILVRGILIRPEHRGDASVQNWFEKETGCQPVYLLRFDVD